MGNLCGRIEESHPHPSPQRPLLSTPRPPSSSPLPKRTTKVGGPARTLGGSTGVLGGGDDARRKAAEAAEARRKASEKGGRLQAQLSAQKKQTRVGVLAEASGQETRARDADEAAKARNWE